MSRMLGNARSRARAVAQRDPFLVTARIDAGRTPVRVWNAIYMWLSLFLFFIYFFSFFSFLSLVTEVDKKECEK